MELGATEREREREREREQRAPDEWNMVFEEAVL